MPRTQAIARKSEFLMFFGKTPLAKVRPKEFKPRDPKDKPTLLEGVPSGAFLALMPLGLSFWNFIVSYFTEENRGKSIGGGVAGLAIAAVLAGLGYAGRVNEDEQDKNFFHTYAQKSDPNEQLSDLVLPSTLTDLINEKIQNVTKGGVAFNAFGEKGLGKTHTARAISNLLKEKFKNAKVDTHEVLNKFINEGGGIFGGKSSIEKLKEILVYAYLEAEKENSGCKDGEIKVIKHLIFEEARMFESGVYTDELKTLLDEFKEARGLVITFTNNSRKVDDALAGRGRVVNLRYDYPTEKEKIGVFKKHFSLNNKSSVSFNDAEIRKALIPEIDEKSTQYSSFNDQEKELLVRVKRELPTLTGFEIKEIAEEVAKNYPSTVSLKEQAVSKLATVLYEKMNVSADTQTITVRQDTIEKIIRLSWNPAPVTPNP